jgi:hypothetical protein
VSLLRNVLQRKDEDEVPESTPSTWIERSKNTDGKACMSMTRRRHTAHYRTCCMNALRARATQVAIPPLNDNSLSEILQVRLLVPGGKEETRSPYVPVDPDDGVST